MGREAIILAGGLGTRLQPLVSDRPKPMALVNGKPFLSYLLNYLDKNSFTHVILAVGFKFEIVSNYFGNHFRNIKITYAIEEKPLGTGGAILNSLKFSESEYSFILNGDTYFPVSFDEMESIARQNYSDLVVAIRQLDDVSRYGTITLGDSGRVKGFIEKKPEHHPGLINGGVYFLKNQSILHLPFPGVFSFENDFLMKFFESKAFHGMVFPGYFIDIGIPETYQQAQQDFFIFGEE
jgi:D-glycero-alpha-D-manno-heptose 1-phosphate guanylyltransferase